MEELPAPNHEGRSDNWMRIYDFGMAFHPLILVDVCPDWTVDKD